MKITRPRHPLDPDTRSRSIFVESKWFTMIINGPIWLFSIRLGRFMDLGMFERKNV